MTDHNSNEDSIVQPPKVRNLFFLITGVLLTWIVLGLLPYAIFSGVSGLSDHSISKWGSLGDTFGMVNSLFSGLAFAALLFTLWQQHTELKITREDLRRSIEAQQSSASSAVKQLELEKVRIKVDVMITRIENERAVRIAEATTTVNNKRLVFEAKDSLKRLMSQLDQMTQKI